MTGRTLLDADMQTIGRWIGESWRWWTGELAALVPARLRRAGGEGLPRLRFAAGRLVAREAPRGRIVVVLPAGLCLVRTIVRPRIGTADMRRMLALEADRLFPFPAGSGLAAGQVGGAAEEAGKVEIAIAGIALATAEQVAAAVAETGTVAARVVVEDRDAIDFAPAMRDAGLLARPRSATPLVWGLVAALVLLNLAALVWRDQARVDRLAALVEAQQPAVGIAQTIGRRAERGRSLVSRTAALRRRHDALGAMAAVSRALPPGAWLQRYVWDGESVRLSGYRPPRSDVASALRASGGFAEVASLGEQSAAAIPAGEPFDVTAKIAR